jgi:2,3-bisphosphoglycerate-dependent phosphoglycerate mutase
MEAGERAFRHISERVDELGADQRRDSLKVLVGHGGAFRHAACHMNVLDESDVPRLSMEYCGAIYVERLPGDRWRHAAGEWKQRMPENMVAD